jgi:hypothetical protein
MSRITAENHGSIFGRLFLLLLFVVVLERSDEDYQVTVPKVSRFLVAWSPRFSKVSHNHSSVSVLDHGSTLNAPMLGLEIPCHSQNGLDCYGIIDSPSPTTV